MDAEHIRHEEETQGQERSRRGRENMGSTERWMAMLGGGLLGLWGLSRRSRGGLLMAGLGGVLAYWGRTGRNPVYDAVGVTEEDMTDTGTPWSRHIHASKTITIQKSPEEVYRFWRDLENLVHVMPHLKSVEVQTPERQHWVGEAPGGRLLEWDAQIVEDRENAYIAWRSLDGADVDHRGSVSFTPAPGGRGTVVTATWRYRPPLGVFSAMVAKLMQMAPEDQVEVGLRRMKQWLETGEFASSESPSGREATEGETGRGVRTSMTSGMAGPTEAEPVDEDVVTEASEESFPASDAPSWTQRREER